MSNIGLELALRESRHRPGALRGRRQVRDGRDDEARHCRSVASSPGTSSSRSTCSPATASRPALNVLRVMADTGRELADLASELVTYPQVLVNVRVRERKDLSTVPAVADAMKRVEERLAGQRAPAGSLLGHRAAAAHHARGERPAGDSGLGGGDRGRREGDAGVAGVRCPVFGPGTGPVIGPVLGTGIGRRDQCSMTCGSRFAGCVIRRGSRSSRSSTLTLAIGVNVSVLSIADAVLFRPLPYEDPDSVFVLRMVNQQTGQRYTRIAGDLLQAINDHHSIGQRRRTHGRGSAARRRRRRAGAEMVAALAVTRELFQSARRAPARGRIFDPPDASGLRPSRDAQRYGGWRTRFGGDPTVVGRPLSIGGTHAWTSSGCCRPILCFPSTFAAPPARS